jgi:hypothetical protein
MQPGGHVIDYLHTNLGSGSSLLGGVTTTSDSTGAAGLQLYLPHPAGVEHSPLSLPDQYSQSAGLLMLQQQQQAQQQSQQQHYLYEMLPHHVQQQQQQGPTTTTTALQAAGAGGGFLPLVQHQQQHQQQQPGPPHAVGGTMVQMSLELSGQHAITVGPPQLLSIGAITGADVTTAPLSGGGWHVTLRGTQDQVATARQLLGSLLSQQVMPPPVATTQSQVPPQTG